jgi:hypothetical protein
VPTLPAAAETAALERESAAAAPAPAAAAAAVAAAPAAAAAAAEDARIAALARDPVGGYWAVPDARDGWKWSRGGGA